MSGEDQGEALSKLFASRYRLAIVADSRLKRAPIGTCSRIVSLSNEIVSSHIMESSLVKE